jgi:polar amino acid transport system substrate-binding protein
VRQPLFLELEQRMSIRLSRASILALVAVALAGTALPAHADGLDDITKAGTLRVAVPQDFPPFGSAGPDLQPQGYDIDMAALVAKGLGVKLQLVPVESANRLPYLQTNKVDIVISTLGKTPERAAVIDFTSAYAPYYSGVFGPASISVGGPADLAGKTIGVARGTLEDIEVSKIAPPTLVMKRFEDNATLITAFLTGQVPLIATGTPVAAAIMAKHPQIKPEKKFILKDSPCFIGLNKNEPKLLAKINAIIVAAKKDGVLDSMSRKWLGYALPPDLPV